MRGRLKINLFFIIFNLLITPHYAISELKEKTKKVEFAAIYKDVQSITKSIRVACNQVCEFEYSPVQVRQSFGDVQCVKPKDGLISSAVILDVKYDDSGDKFEHINNVCVNECNSLYTEYILNFNEVTCENGKTTNNKTARLNETVSNQPDEHGPQNLSTSTPTQNSDCEKVSTNNNENDIRNCNFSIKTANTASTQRELKRAIDYCNKVNDSNMTEFCLQKIKSISGFDDAISSVENVANSVEDFENRSEQCNEERERTANCCQDPFSCLMGGGGGDSGSGTQMIGWLASALTAVAQSTARSLKDQCDLSKKLMAGGVAANGAAALICTDKIKDCNNACQGLISESDKIVKQLSPYCKSGSKYLAFSEISDACQSTYSEFKGFKDSAERTVASCKREKEKAQSFAIASAGNAAAQAIAQDCEKFAETTPKANGLIPPPMEVENTFNGDCSNPAFYNDPICVRCRANPSRAECKNIIGINPIAQNPGNNTPVVPGGGGGARPDAFGPSLGTDVDFPGEGAEMQSIKAANANLSQTAGGGGGAGLGNGNGGGVGAAAAKGGGGGGYGKGYKTDIMQGTRGGGGYTSNVGVRSGSGYSPRGGGGKFANREKVGKKGYNLRDFLPNGKKYAKRDVAGLGKNPKEIGGAHENIFQMVSKRFKAVCDRGVLYDCKK